MEPIHAELLGLATELEAVKGQVQTSATHYETSLHGPPQPCQVQVHSITGD